MEIPAHWSIILCMSKLKIDFCKECICILWSILLSLLYFSKAFVEIKSPSHFAVFFNGILNICHVLGSKIPRKTSKFLARFSYALYETIHFLYDMIRFLHDMVRFLHNMMHFLYGKVHFSLDMIHFSYAF